MTNQQLMSQEKEAKFGKPEKSELEMEQYAPDPEADAVVLYDYGKMSFVFAGHSKPIQVERHVKIKFLKRSAFDKYGDVRIPFYHYDNMEEINGLKVMVHNPDGETIKLRNKDIFTEEYNEGWSFVKFSFPQLEEGSVAEYIFTRETERYLNPVTWYFQKEIPVAWSELILEIPDWYDYIFLTQGRTPDINDKNSRRMNIPYRLPSETNATMRLYGERSGGVVTKTVSTLVTEYRTVMKDAPALREEKYISTMDNYYSKMQLQLRSYQVRDGIWEKAFESWEKLAQELWSASGFGGQLEASRHGRNVLEAVGPGFQSARDQKEQIALVHNYLTNNIHWDGSYQIICTSNLTNVLNNKSGSSGELNLLFISALREAGMTAMPALVSTRDHGRNFELYPFVDQFNHVIAIVKLDDGDYFFDVSNDPLPFGFLRRDAINYRAWVVDQQAPTWVDIDIPLSSSTMALTLSMDTTGNASGSSQVKLSGYPYVDAVNGTSGDHAESLAKGLHGELAALQLGEITMEEEQGLQKSVLLNYQIEANTLLPLDDTLSALNLWMFSDFLENPFKQESRNFPIELSYPFQKKYIVNIEVPDGFELISKPKDIRYVLEDEGAWFQYMTQVIGNRIQLFVDVGFQRLYYKTEEFDNLKQFFTETQKKISETVLLKTTR